MIEYCITDIADGPVMYDCVRQPDHSILFDEN